MVVVYTMKGNIDKDILRYEIVDRYNKLHDSTIYVRLYYEDGIPYMTDGKHVSISHTAIGNGERIELVAIADEPIGIDIESLSRPVNMGISRRFFTRNEQKYVSNNRERLLEVWQKKEAKGKALKIGMYMDDVTTDDRYREYDLFEDYRVILYGGEREVVFIAM